MNLQDSNPCNHGIPAKVWELLRRNEAFLEKTEELNSYQGKEERWEKFMLVNKEDNYYAATAWNWMHEPVIIPRGLGPKRGQPQRLGPRIEEDQGEFLEEYEEDKREGRAPLKLDSTWANTPRGFQKAYRDCWADHTADICEIVPSGLYPNKDAIPSGIETAPALPHEDHSQAALDSCFSNTALFWHWTVETNRVFAVPRVFSMRGKNSRNKIIKLITKKLEEDSPPPKVQLYGTVTQWRSFLTVEDFCESDSLSRGAAIKKTIKALGYGKDLDTVTRENQTYSRIEGHTQAINYSNADCPEQNGWIQLVYPKVYSIKEIIKIAEERKNSPVRQ